jgi:hypothetical protein
VIFGGSEIALPFVVLRSCFLLTIFWSSSQPYIPIPYGLWRRSYTNFSFVPAVIVLHCIVIYSALTRLLVGGVAKRSGSRILVLVRYCGADFGEWMGRIRCGIWNCNAWNGYDSSSFSQSRFTLIPGFELHCGHLHVKGRPRHHPFHLTEGSNPLSQAMVTLANKNVVTTL